MNSLTPFTSPFTLAQAREAGITRDRLQWPAYQRVMHGVYAPAGPLDLHTRVAAARLVLPDDAIATGRTALRLFGLDLGSDFPLTFVTEQKVRVRHRGVTLVVVESMPDHRKRIALTEDACAFILDTEPLLEAVTAVDRALYRRLVTRNALLASPLTPTARAAYAHVDAGAQSPWETKLRLCLTRSGLPRPTTQATITDRGRFIGRVDLLYAEYRVVIEYEGGQHLTDPEQWRKDIDRYAALARLDYTVIRVTAARMRKANDVVSEVFQALRESGYRGPAPRFAASWWLAFG
jgi:very-short-patch-repair endonuclease